jgi:hypothetical protein
MPRLGITPLVAALLAAPLVLTGCSKDAGNPLSPSGPGSAAGTLSAADMKSGQAQTFDGSSSRRRARAMFVHASPDAPAVDIFVGARRVARNVEFPENTSYLSFRPGARRVKVNVAGTSTTVIDATVALEPRRNYTVFAANNVASIEPLVLQDDLTRPAPGNAHVRFVHLSPNAPAVDVAIAGGPVVFGNKAFKDYTSFTPVPAGSYDLEVRVAGTTTVALPLPGIQLREGQIYTVFAKGLLGGSGAQALGAGIIVNSERKRWDRDDRDDDDDNMIAGSATR